MKKLIFVLFVFVTFLSSAQTSNSTGRNWTTGSHWVGGTSPGLTMAATANVTINTYTIAGSSGAPVTMNFNGSSNSPGKLTVKANDTLIIYGNVTFANKSMELVLEANAVMIIIGNLTMQNKITIASSGTLAVSGTLNMTGAAGQSSFSGTGNVYAGAFAGNAQTVIDGGGPPDSSFTIDQLSDDGFGAIETFIGGGGVIPLPVELTYFNVTKSTNGLLLSWQTASELNNDYFEIQRSENGTDFYVIGKVDGNGTSNTVHNYSFIDTPILPVTYYRLRQVDYDGAFEFSKIKVGYADKLASSLKITTYPNPAVEKVSFKSVQPIVFEQLQLLNLSGQTVANLTNLVEGNGLTLDVLLPSLEKGLYYIKFRTQTGETGIHKLMIK